MTLYDLFYHFHYSKFNNELSANQFAKLMLHSFTTTKSIVLVAKNLDDGIGDYVSQLYFAKKFMDLLKDYPEVDLKVISYVSGKKLELAKRIAKDIFDETQLLILPENENYQSQPLIIGKPDESQKKFLSTVTESADFIFNIAIGLTSINRQLHMGEQNWKIDSLRQLALPCNEHAFINSWVQYEYKSKLMPSINDLYLIEYTNFQEAGPLYAENAMGIHENQVGLRFIDSIQEAITKSRETLLHDLGEDEDIKRYIPLDGKSRQSFSVGYLQSCDTSRAFALMAAQTSPNEQGDMNAFVNTDFYDEKASNREYSDKARKKAEFQQTLKNLGYTHIELISDLHQEPEVTILDENQEKKRIFRLIKFAGVSEKNKTTLLALSEMVASSGDTSFSEVLTSGLKQNETALPFLQQYITSESSCSLSTLEEVEAWRTPPEHQELCLYLDYLKQKQIKTSNVYLSHTAILNFDYDALGDRELYIKKNREKIAASWNKFCQFLHDKRNEASHFNELLVTYTFHHLLVNNQLDTFKELAVSLGKNAFNNETLLHVALKLRNVEAARFLIEQNLCDVNQPFSFNGYTALHMAVHQGDEAMVKLLISSPNIDLNALDKGKNTPFLLSAIVGKINIFNRLATEINPSSKALSEMFIIALKNGNAELGRELVESQKINWEDEKLKEDLNVLLLEGVRNTSLKAVELSLKYGADANFIGTAIPIHAAITNYLKAQPENKKNEAMTIIELLLKNYADPNLLDIPSYNQPLNLAISYGNFQLFELLMRNRANIEPVITQLGYNGILNCFKNDQDKSLVKTIIDSQISLGASPKSAEIKTPEVPELREDSLLIQNPHTFFENQKDDTYPIWLILLFCIPIAGQLGFLIYTLLDCCMPVEENQTQSDENFQKK